MKLRTIPGIQKYKEHNLKKSVSNTQIKYTLTFCHICFSFFLKKKKMPHLQLEIAPHPPSSLHCPKFGI